MLSNFVKRILSKSAILSLCILALLSQDAKGQSQKLVINMFLIAGPDSLERETALQVASLVKSRFMSDLGIELKIPRVRNRKDLYPNFSTVDGMYERYYAWKHWLTNKGRLPSKRIQYFMFPPMRRDGIKYLAGLSGVCAKKIKWSISMANAELKNSYNEDRFIHSAIVMYHELLHSQGAQHYDDIPNVMHSNALAFVTGFGGIDLPLLDVSKAQIALCRS